MIQHVPNAQGPTFRSQNSMGHNITTIAAAVIIINI